MRNKKVPTHSINEINMKCVRCLIFHFVWWNRQTKMWLAQRKAPESSILVLGRFLLIFSLGLWNCLFFRQKTGNDGSCPEKRLVVRSKSALSSMQRVCHQDWGAFCWVRRCNALIHHILFSPTFLLPEKRVLGNEIVEKMKFSNIDHSIVRAGYVKKTHSPQMKI